MSLSQLDYFELPASFILNICTFLANMITTHSFYICSYQFRKITQHARSNMKIWFENLQIEPDGEPNHCQIFYQDRFYL